MDHVGPLEDTNWDNAKLSSLTHPGLELRAALRDGAAGQVVCFSMPQLPYL